MHIDLLDNDSYISEADFDKTITPELQKFFKSNNLIQKHYLEGYNCQRCEELCDLSIQRVDEKIFVDCPTGYIKRLFLEPKDVNGYRLSKSSLVAKLKKNINLPQLNISEIRSFELLGNSQDKNKFFVFRDSLPEGHDLILEDIKTNLDCEELYVIVQYKRLRDDVFYKLSSENIFIYSLEELILSRSFELPEKEHFLKKPIFPIDVELEIFLSDRTVKYKNQKIIFGQSKKLFQWFYHLAMRQWH